MKHFNVSRVSFCYLNLLAQAIRIRAQNEASYQPTKLMQSVPCIWSSNQQTNLKGKFHRSHDFFSTKVPMTAAYSGDVIKW